MMMIVLRLLSLLGLKSRWHRHFSPGSWVGFFFRGGGVSLDSWTPGPKPLCHRHPTGPHPSGLWWTPAKGDSTKRDCALGPARLVGLVRRGEQGRGRHHRPVAEVVAAAQHVAHPGLVLALRDLRTLPPREIGPPRQQQAAHAGMDARARDLVGGGGGAVADRLPQADHLRIVGAFEARPALGAEIEELRPMLLRGGEPAEGVVALALRRRRIL